MPHLNEAVLSGVDLKHVSTTIQLDNPFWIDPKKFSRPAPAGSDVKDETIMGDACM